MRADAGMTPRRRMRVRRGSLPHAQVVARLTTSAIWQQQLDGTEQRAAGRGAHDSGASTRLGQQLPQQGPRRAPIAARIASWPRADAGREQQVRDVDARNAAAPRPRSATARVPGDLAHEVGVVLTPTPSRRRSPVLDASHSPMRAIRRAPAPRSRRPAAVPPYPAAARRASARPPSSAPQGTLTCTDAGIATIVLVTLFSWSVRLTADRRRSGGASGLSTTTSGAPGPSRTREERGRAGGRLGP